MSIKCICDPDGEHGETINLWLCPCLECTKLEWEAGIQFYTLTQERQYNWPEHYPNNNQKEGQS